MSDGAVVTASLTDLYAQWKVNSYSVLFHPNGADTVNTVKQNFVYDIPQNLRANSFARKGHAFQGWTKNPYTVASVTNRIVTTVTNSVPVATNSLLVATNAVPPVSGASTNMTNVVVVTTNIVVTSTSNLNTKVDFPDQARVSKLIGSGTLDLYAVWTINSYTIAFDPGAERVKGETPCLGCHYGKTFSMPNSGFSRAGYAFRGWTDQLGGEVVYAAGGVYSNLTDRADAVVALYAVWEGNDQTIEFDAGDSALVSVVTNACGVSWGALPDPGTKEGMVFAGWRYQLEDGNWKMIASEDVCPSPDELGDASISTSGIYRVEARWKSANPGEGRVDEEVFADLAFTTNGPGVLEFDWKTSCEDAWFENGATNHTDYLEFLVNGAREGVYEGFRSGTAAFTNLLADAQTFSWRYVKDGDVDEGEDRAWVSNATWRPGQTVSFWRNDSAGGVWTNRLVFLGDSLGELPEIEGGIAGHEVFSGWWTDPSAGEQIFGDVPLALGATNLYARWSANSYVVKFNANGGTGTMSGQTFTYGQQAALARCRFTRAGYRFEGWARSAGSSAVEYADASQVESLTAQNGGMVTLYAVWKSFVETMDALWPSDGMFSTGASGVWDGWIIDGAGRFAGVCQFKSGKMKKDSCVLSGSITLLGLRKTSVKGTGRLNALGALTATMSVRGASDSFVLSFGRREFRGQWRGYTFQGARNVWKAKDDAAVRSAIDSYYRNTLWTFALEPFNASGPGMGLTRGYTGFSMALKSKGKSRMRGVLTDGTSVSAAGQLVVGESCCYLPVLAQTYSKKGGFGALLSYDAATSNYVSNISAWNTTGAKSAFKADLRPVTAVGRSGGACASSATAILSGLGGVAVRCYPAKGSFKGTCKLPSPQTGKKVSATVNGVFVGAKGYGSAVIKKVQSYPAVIQ